MFHLTHRLMKMHRKVKCGNFYVFRLLYNTIYDDDDDANNDDENESTKNSN